MLNQTKETQVCTNCPEKGPQPLSNFHRKGTGFHKICKSCRNKIEAARYQSPKVERQPSPINTENFIALETRIVTLEKRLHAKAASFAHDNLDADDIYSAMVEAILTKSQPDDSDATIMQRANWTATDYVRKNSAYSQYVEELDVDESEAEKAGFKIVTNPRAIEEALIQNEKYAEIKAVIEALPEENRKIVAMLSIGYKQREIATELHVSETAVTEKLKVIRATLKLSLA